MFATPLGVFYAISYHRQVASVIIGKWRKFSSGSDISYHRQVAQVMAVSEAWCGAFGCSGWLNSPLGLRVGLEGLGMDWEGVKSGMLMPAFRAKTKKDKSNE